MKLKVKNHFTKEMIKPILVPILDINYYLPNFRKFNKDYLFNKNNYNYHINLDMNDILREDNQSDDGTNEESKNVIEDLIYTSNINTNKISKHNYVRNNYGFNYLECLYKLTFGEIWDLYNLYNEQKLNLDKNISSSTKESIDKLITKTEEELLIKIT